MDNNTVYILAIVVVIIIAIIGWILYKQITGTHKKEEKDVYQNIAIIPPGWQFFPNPTTGDRPGTVFRITPENQRFLVTETGASRLQQH